MSQSPLLLPTAVAALACAALIGCGSSSPKDGSSSSATNAGASTHVKASPTPEEAASARAQIKSPEQVVVRIGKREITKGELYRWMSIGPSERREVPEPPEFNRCIINLRKAEQVSAGGEGLAANSLKGVCVKRYQEELRSALGSLVNNTWLIGEATEDGIAIDQGVAQTFKASLARFAKQPGGFAGVTKLTGQTTSDLMYEIKALVASEKVYARISAKTPKLTPSSVARYYRRHKHDYLVSEQRDLYILHTRSRASALHAKAEIQAGKSFASVVKTLKVTQPVGSKEGRDRTLTRESYAQRNLIDAIFSARLGVLSGPFELNPKTTKYIASGFYVFKALHKVPPHQVSFAAVKAQIEQQLGVALRNDARKAFVKAYKAKWKARTDCSPGYVIENCRQFNGKESEHVDPYVL